MPKPAIRGNYDLRSSPLFRLRTRKSLAKILCVSLETLQEISGKSNFYKDNEISCDLYSRLWKHKIEKDLWLRTEPTVELSKLYRPIDIPSLQLKKLQARIAVLLSRIAPPDWLFSPVKRRSYVDNAVRHRGAKAFWMMDVADYFPSCTAKKVAGFFLKTLECSPDVTAILVHISTLDQKLPQGSPCSPILAYFTNLEMWSKISEIVESANLNHSVYADDLTISGDLIRKSTIWEIKKTFHCHGLRLKASKEISLIHRPADITGVIIAGTSARLPNRQLKKLHELRIQRLSISDPRELKYLDNMIAGREAQKRQVEQKT